MAIILAADITLCFFVHFDFCGYQARTHFPYIYLLYPPPTHLLFIYPHYWSPDSDDRVKATIHLFLFSFCLFIILYLIRIFSCVCMCVCLFFDLLLLLLLLFSSLLVHPSIVQGSETYENVCYFLGTLGSCNRGPYIHSPSSRFLSHLMSVPD